MNYEFHHGAELCALCRREQRSMGEVMLRLEMERSYRDRESILAEMQKNLETMQDSIRDGLDPHRTWRGKFTGGDAVKLLAFAPESEMGSGLTETVAAAMAVAEVNASMGRIVAAPTAGASGILPAVLLTHGKRAGLEDLELCMGLFAAGAVGCIIAGQASISGAAGGCQAETGTAAAMAAAALAELRGADPETALHAAAMALKNCMGLVCDPVGGLVECPCVKRNAIGAANAVLSCDLALAGIRSLIPFDEVVEAMRSVGTQMHPDLRETARGGLAATPTAQQLVEQAGL